MMWEDKDQELQESIARAEKAVVKAFKNGHLYKPAGMWSEDEIITFYRTLESAFINAFNGVSDAQA